LEVSQHGIQYRVPKINFSSKPFNGKKYDEQVINRVGMWRGAAETDQSASTIGASIMAK